MKTNDAESRIQVYFVAAGLEPGGAPSRKAPGRAPGRRDPDSDILPPQARAHWHQRWP